MIFDIFNTAARILRTFGSTNQEASANPGDDAVAKGWPPVSAERFLLLHPTLPLWHDWVASERDWKLKQEERSRPSPP